MSEHLIASYNVTITGNTIVNGSGNGGTYLSTASNFLGTATKITSCKFFLQKSGVPTGNCYAKLYAITGTPGSTGTPTGSALATSDAVDVSTISGSVGWYTFTFSGVNQYLMTAGVYYEIAFEYTVATTDYIEVFYAANTASINGSSLISTTWTEQSHAYVYYVYGLDVLGSVTTQAVSDVTNNSCTGNGTITSTGGEATVSMRRGFCYKVGTTGDPTISDSVAYDDGSFGVGAYTKSITGLSYNTDYRVRAYITNDAGTSYGSTVQLNLVATTLLTIGTAYVNILASEISETEINASFVRLKEIRIK